MESQLRGLGRSQFSPLVGVDKWSQGQFLGTEVMTGNSAIVSKRVRKRCSVQGSALKKSPESEPW